MEEKLSHLYNFISTFSLFNDYETQRDNWCTNEISSWAFWQMIKLPLNTDVQRFTCTQQLRVQHNETTQNNNRAPLGSHRNGNA